jgi:transcription elongation factor Elf1
MNNPETCNHEKTVKAGIHTKVGMRVQKLKCNNCGKTVYGKVLEKVN